LHQHIGIAAGMGGALGTGAKQHQPGHPVGAAYSKKLGCGQEQGSSHGRLNECVERRVLIGSSKVQKRAGKCKGDFNR
jgi:hypothetical protein